MEDYEINGQKINVDKTFLVDTKKKYDAVMSLLKNQDRLIELYSEPDLSVFSKRNKKEYLIFDGRNEMNAYVKITNGIDKIIKEGLEEIFNNGR